MISGPQRPTHFAAFGRLTKFADCFNPPPAFRSIAVKSVTKIAGIVVAALIAMAVALPWLVNVNRFHPEIETSLSSALGRPVTLGNLSLTFLASGVKADQLTIADDPRFSSAPFIQAKSLVVGVELLPLLFSKRLNVTELRIVNPEITLLRNRDGVWNFSSLGDQTSKSAQVAAPSSAPRNVNVAVLEVVDGTLMLGFTTGKRNPISYNKGNASFHNFSFTSAFRVSASAELPGGGSLKIDGNAGPINSADISLTPVQAKVTLRKLDLAQSALVSPALGIDGSADFDGTLTSDGSIAKANGTAKATSLKLAPKGSPANVPVHLVLAIEHDVKNESGKLVQGDVTIGKALAKLTGTYDMHGETTAIHIQLNGQAMPVDDLQGLLPALGVVLPTGSRLKGGTLSLDIDSTGPLDRVVSTGLLKMSNTALAGFNLDSRLSAISMFAGKRMGNDTVIENFASELRRSPDGTRLDKVDVVISGLGTVTGAGTVGSNNELDFKMVANLTGAGSVLTKVAGFGSGGIPVSIGGTTANPTFTPDMPGIVTDKLKGIMGGKDNPLGALFGKKKR
jgi:AsmA protein